MARTSSPGPGSRLASYGRGSTATPRGRPYMVMMRWLTPVPLSRARPIVPLALFAQ